MSSEAEPTRLATRKLEKRFGATLALSELSFDVRPGEFHALCGENGAGKSTLIKTVSGIYPHGSYEGDILVDGRIAHFRGVRDAERAGIVVIHQELSLIPQLSIAENLFLGRLPTRLGLLDRERMLRESTALLARLGSTLDPREPVSSLGVGHAQLVEIARALDKNARVLILDEPTAALSEREVDALFPVLRELKQAGVSLVYVSHRLPEVFALSDRITVLRDGRSVTTLNTSETSEPEVVRHMVGRSLASVFPEHAEPAPEAPVCLSVCKLSVDGPLGSSLTLRDVSFEVRAGEVLGIGGLVGAGRSELLLHLYGAFGRRTAGTVELLGARYDDPSPARSIERGLVLVSEDRKQQGLVLEETVGFNLTLADLNDFARFGLIRRAVEAKAQAEMASEVRLQRDRLPLPVSALSGGNQQKVVLGRALMCHPRVLLLDEPTRGVDVGAKAEIYQLIASQCRAGMAVVLVTSELPELLGLADRIVMLGDGRVRGRFLRHEATQERLLAAALSDDAKDGQASKGVAHGD